MNSSRSEPDELTVVYARMSGLLPSEETVGTALELITSLARDTIAGATGSGVSLLDRSGQRTSSAATSALVQELDTLQYALDQGPCLAAWADGLAVEVDDMAADARWPRWAREAAARGIGSTLSAPLIWAGKPLGAIKVYADQPHAFDAFSADLLQRFAEQAAIFVANVVTLRDAESLSEQLKSALRRRDTIAMARGIVMLREDVDAEDAYRWLIAASVRTRSPLVDVARDVLQSVRDGVK